MCKTCKCIDYAIAMSKLATTKRKKKVITKKKKIKHFQKSLFNLLEFKFNEISNLEKIKTVKITK